MALAPSTCTFCMSRWDEETTKEFPNGAKLTRAEVTQSYSGDMSGEGTVEYIMAYTPGSPVKFVGLEVLTGTIGGRSGTVVIQHDGVFSGSSAHSSWIFVEGSGTDELISLHGSGSYDSVDQQTVNSSFIYSFGEA
jgi:Protein of unknown function (DUF3224)